MTGTAPRRSDACVSDLTLDRVVAGAAIGDELGAHLETCARCRERLELLELSRDRSADLVEDLIRATRPGGTSPSAPEPASPSSGFGLPRLAVAALVLLAVTASAVWMLEQRIGEKTPAPPADSLRIKGSSMRFFVQRGEDVVPGVSGERYQEGDALRFTVSNDQPIYFFLVGVEASGKVSAYVPFEGARSMALEPGIEQAMPGSLVLDGSAETEYFVGLFTAEALELAEIEAALDQVYSGRETMDVALEALPLPGQHRWVVVHRETP